MRAPDWSCPQCGFRPRPFHTIKALEHIEHCQGIPTAPLREALSGLDEFTMARLNRLSPTFLLEAEADPPTPNCHAILRLSDRSFIAFCHDGPELADLEINDLILLDERAMLIQQIIRCPGFIYLWVKPIPRGTP